MAAIYRTDHVGSMIRPARLLDARDDFHAGKLSREAPTKIEDECILEALELQRQTGIAVFTDGELRRDSYTTDQYDAIEGFAAEFPVTEQTKPDGTKVQVEMHTKPVAGKLRQVRRLAQHEAAFLKQHAPGPWKITMPTPIRRGPARQAPPAPYTSWDEVQRDIVDIFKGEMMALKEEGVTYFQLDKVITTYTNDDSRAALAKNYGLDPEKALEAEIAWENACYDAVRGEGITLAMHLCRGNRTAWSGGTGGYDWPAEHLFNDLHVDRFLLEFDTARAGGFEPLRHMPNGKVAMLGLISTKTDKLEQQDDLLRRIEEAAKYCPLDQLALGPQCGFQSAANRDGAAMTIDDQKRKLELIVDTAQKVWG